MRVTEIDGAAVTRASSAAVKPSCVLPSSPPKLIAKLALSGLMLTVPLPAEITPLVVFTSIRSLTSVNAALLAVVILAIVPI